MMGIYQITNTVNNKIYIGSSANITLRWKQHIEQLYYKIHENYKLQDDYNRYGLQAFSFSVLEVVKDKKDLLPKEQNWIDSIDISINYNILPYSNFNHLETMKDSYNIMEFKIDKEAILKLKNNIQICSHLKLNSIGDKKTSLSKHWFNDSETKLIEQLTNNIKNYGKNIMKTRSYYWTTFITYQRKVAGNGIVKKYIGFNDIPKTKCNVLAYCANNFPNKTIQRNLKDTYEINDDGFAINMLLKWIINVSDITKPIHIYIPSSRMRAILIDWLNNENI